MDEDGTSRAGDASLGGMDAEPHTDEHLARWVDDFDVFYRGCRDRLYRVLAVALRDPDLAAEAIDEALTRAFADWDRVRMTDRPEGWVYRVAHNWALDRLRRRRRALRHRWDDAAVVWMPDVPDPRLAEAVGALRIGQRSVVVLRILMDWSEEQVAEVLGVAKGTVKSRLNRGLERLRRAVE